MPDSARSEAEAIAIRGVIEQAFDVWDKKRAQTQQEEQKRRAFAGAMPAWIMCAISIIGFVLVAGATNQKVSDNSRRIDDIERREGLRDEENKTMRENLAAIRASLEALTGGPRR